MEVTEAISTGVIAALLSSAAWTLLLLLKSLNDFSRTGPQLKTEVLNYYARYSLFSLGRLGLWSWLLSFFIASSGVLLYGCASMLFNLRFDLLSACSAAFISLIVIVAGRFLFVLLYSPAVIAASYHYRLSRLYPLWRLLSPYRLRILLNSVLLISTTLIAISIYKVGSLFQYSLLVGSATIIFSMGLIRWSEQRRLESEELRRRNSEAERPNIVMIGCDTLRSDRLGVANYCRSLTPTIDQFAKKGYQFTNCYVPCARTAPSLISWMTGMWPHRYGVRDNFISDEETWIPAEGLPRLLINAGYRTGAISDWTGGDLGKFLLGFERLDLPTDQWNIKYLLRQGPKDIRLFLSLFVHNPLGKIFLPEIYYLAGVPLTRKVGRDAREMLSEFADDDKPFFLNIFIAATHPPFGSEYPYYTLFSDRAYKGESKFVMARLTDPFEIIQRQGEAREEFDLDQIIDLYDGCVKSFDDEVKCILDHLHDCGLKENTIVVIYSDHGMEFFEHETWGQGNSIFSDLSSKVPFIMVDPRKKGGKVIPEVVRSVDLVPTLLDLAEIKNPGSMDGVSLVPFIEGMVNIPTLPAFNETGVWLTDLPCMPKDHLRYPHLMELLEVPDKQSGTLAIKPEFRDLIIIAKDRMVRMGPWKLTYQPLTSGALFKLFNLISDPDCRQNVYDQYPEIAEDLKQRLIAWMLEDPVYRRWQDKANLNVCSQASHSQASQMMSGHV
ncbi:sulfatase [Nitrosococcus wardiae]|uniref:Sulfatase N-terminal domain-containing protein n=1 Tax=Nitrosococcus wardiae TaxID=1814290 RepID=A0A4P7C0W4_9GAMM|nr:sulfatase [Nitrosococcus wardiae]QBQ54502.1 hypothetical protein E3U44_08275 [Nitrosococcus wardiae]